MTVQAERSPRVARMRRLVAALGAAMAVAVAATLVRADSLQSPSSSLPAGPPGLEELWNGEAALVLDRKWTSAALGVTGGLSGVYSGAHVEIVGGTWYLFNRRTLPEPCPGHAPNSRKMGTEVRASPDRGATWGQPVTILAPGGATHWSCAATDGDATFDPRTGTWRYLFQCQAGRAEWQGCYAERRGVSPLGPFDAPDPDPNPVITPGLLWGRICDDPGDDCHHGAAAPVKDEGTFDVFDYDDGSWLVGFHGWDGSRGYRGIARTATFRRDGWRVDGEEETPTDAVLDAADAAGWRENWRDGGPVGAGAASILREDDWYYQLAEVPDVSLGCTAGQSWNLGLFRASDPATTTWQQFPGGNPVVYSSRMAEGGLESAPCNVEYPRLFRDGATGTTYLMHGRVSTDPAYDGIYVYRLEWNRNMLHNGGFWRADAEGWQPHPGTPVQLNVERAPNRSPDGTPYLSLSCGAPSCDGGQSVYQDMAVAPDRAGERLAFGGTFRADAGNGGLGMTVHQLDGTGKLVATVEVPVTLGEAFARARGELEVHERARRLRFQLYPRTPGAIRADNLYVIPQEGCAGRRYPAC